MKKLFLICIILTSGLTAFQAKSQVAAGSPSQAAINFTKSMLALKVKDAEKYMTKSSAIALDQLAPMIESQTASIPDSVKTLLNSAKVTTSNEKINNDSATVDVTTSLTAAYNNSKQETKTLSLIKEDGAWKVVFDIMKNMQGGGTDSSDGKDSTNK